MDSNTDSNTDPATPRDYVLEYIRRGWNPVQIPYMTKKPVGNDWQQRCIDLTNVDQFFPETGQWNVGVQLGTKSGNLIDADLDCPEALGLAGWFFPKTDAVFGRLATPWSHALYNSPELVAMGKATLQFKDPDATAGDKGMLLELRCGGGGKGAQTVFPGSVHPSGQPITWASFGSPASVTGDALLQAARWTAAFSLMVRGWPGHGLRHDAALTLSGLFGRLGLEKERSAELLRLIAQVAGDDDPEDRAACACDPDTEKMRGLPKLIDLFGEKRAKKIAEWLGFKEKSRGKASFDTSGLDTVPYQSGPSFDTSGLDDLVAGTALVALAPGDVAMFREHPTDTGNSQFLVRINEGDIRYCHAFKAWFIWTGGYWRRDDNGEIMRRAERAVQMMFQQFSALPAGDPQKSAWINHALRSEKRGRLTDMVALAQVDSRAVLDYRLLDAEPLLVGVLNGVIDLKTGEFREGRREDYITMRANVEYDPDAKCPNWLAFQKRISGAHSGLIEYKQRAFGLCLSGEVPEILWICHGGGSNGKTTELETVADILGDYAYAVAASLLVAEQNSKGATPEIVALKDRRAIFINETQMNDWLNEGRVKYICGTDTMSGRNLYEGTINWKPTHKPFLRTNHRPKLRGTDLGLWRRIHYVPYTATFSEDEKILNFRQTDLVPEHPGIFNWMLAGWMEYVHAGRKLNPPACVQECNASYKKDSDITGRWIDLGVEHAPGGRISLKELHAAYVLWFRDEIGEKGNVATQTLANRLEEKGFIKGGGRKQASHNIGTFFADTRLKLGSESDDIPTDAYGVYAAANAPSGQNGSVGA
jgi:P4 family phage/plasmid primase-like protien